MNIIQIQDRLKGLPDTALVNYVEQPMGEVPIYLALGELQRRKEMRDRFQAIPGPGDKTVSEKLINDVKSKGIAAMAPQQMMPGAQGVGAPPMAPEMGPKQLTASGVGALPVKNMQLKEGGIIPGYRLGGIFDKAKKLFKGKGKDAAAAGAGETVDNAGFLTKTGRAILDNPGKTIIAGSLGIPAASYLLGDDDDTSGPGMTKEELDAIRDSFTKKPSPKPPKKNTVETKKTIQDRFKEIEALVGPDNAREAMRKKLEEKDKSSLNMALINAGLGMAAGQSENFLENLIAGAGAGLKDYTATQDELLEAQAELGKTDRAERIALIGQALAQDEAALERAKDIQVASIAGPTVAKAASAAAKIIENLNAQQIQYELALAKAEKAGNEEVAKKLRAELASIYDVKSRMTADSVALSTDPGSYGATPTGTGNLPSNIQEILDIYGG